MKLVKGNFILEIVKFQMNFEKAKVASMVLKPAPKLREAKT